YWHGFSTPFIMSLAVLGIGTVLYTTMNKWTGIYSIFPGKLSFNRVYDWLIEKTDTVSEKVTNFYMTGSLRTYMSIILGTIFIVAAGATVFSNNNVASILILGIVGYGVAILFVIYRAPDIALTQLVIETVTVALFLLTFYHFPKLKKRTESVRTKTTNLIISIGFGVMMTIVGISAVSSNWFDKISDYFIETALPIGGGNNIVNVILVDMRGIDTLFEIAVLGIAVLAIYGLIKLRKD